MSFFIKNNVRFRSESTRNRSDSVQTISTRNPIRTARNHSDSEWKLGVCSEDVGHRKVLETIYFDDVHNDARFDKEQQENNDNK